MTDQPRTSVWPTAFFVTLGFGALLLAGYVAPSNANASGTPTRPVLELLSARSYQSSSSYVTVEGEVRNLSGSRLDKLLVIVTWRGADGTHITSTKVLVEYDPVLPGQATPFKAIAKRNPVMDRFDVEFMEIGGPILPTKSRR
jgi:hypothetical protein